MKISSIDKEKIKEAIKSVEERTSGEIVPVILKQSDFYPAAHFRSSILIGFFFSISCYYFYSFDDPLALIWFQVSGTLIGYFLGYIPFIKKKFSTVREIEEEVYQRALEVFYENKISMTKERTGIVIYVSLLERKVQVLADCGVNEKVPENYWDELVGNLSSDISRGDLVEGIITSIHTCGEKLIENFPIKEDDTNEITDELITDL